MSGVFGVYSKDKSVNIAEKIYYGLYALQHRGKQSAGIAVRDKDLIEWHKDKGLVPEVFKGPDLDKLPGDAGIGHVRYSSSGDVSKGNIEPLVLKYISGYMAIAKNGNIINANHLRGKLEADGCMFHTTNDTEVLAALLTKFRISSEHIEDSVEQMVKYIQGSYSIVMITPRFLIGLRDPLGIMPLCIGKINGATYVISSESAAIDAVDGEFIRDVEPGELVLIDSDGIQSRRLFDCKKSSLCIFEHVYFARPDSIVDGASTHDARVNAGRILAKEHPVQADVVIGIPDGGTDMAYGFAQESNIVAPAGLLRNKYVGRAFIAPNQNAREIAVKIKFNPVKTEVKGKRVVLIDDSIVRGTTTKTLVRMLREAGAKEVHLRIGSPPYKYPCYFGVDTSSRGQLLASKNDKETICEWIGADSLEYISYEGIIKAPVNSKVDFCTSCFTGVYPVDVPKEF